MINYVAVRNLFSSILPPRHVALLPAIFSKFEEIGIRRDIFFVSESNRIRAQTDMLLWQIWKVENDCGFRLMDRISVEEDLGPILLLGRDWDNRDVKKISNRLPLLMFKICVFASNTTDPDVRQRLLDIIDTLREIRHANEEDDS